MQLTVLLN